jgi:uncharacterized protein
MKTGNRRDFLKKSTAAGIIIAGTGINAKQVFSQESSKVKLAYRNLGSTGYKVTEIGFGAMNTRNAELINAAIDSGINYLDTAHGYMNGVNEEIIGTIMKTKRDKVFLTTKISWKNTQEMPDMIETSLKRLQTDHVDLLLLHNIKDEESILNNDFMKIFDDAQKKGQTRFVGFSTHSFSPKLLDAVLKVKFWNAILVAYNYMSPPEFTGSINKARETGIAIIGMKSLLNMRNESAPAPRPYSTQTK